MQNVNLNKCFNVKNQISNDTAEYNIDREITSSQV